MKVKDILERTFAEDEISLQYSSAYESGIAKISAVSYDDYERYGDLDVISIKPVDSCLCLYAEANSQKAIRNLRR